MLISSMLVKRLFLMLFVLLRCFLEDTLLRDLLLSFDVRGSSSEVENLSCCADFAFAFAMTASGNTSPALPLCSASSTDVHP